MSDEPTKACIRVLKLENKVKYILVYPFVKFGKYFYKFMDWLIQFINWCIVRAILRWVGLPVTAGILYKIWLTLSVEVVSAVDDTPIIMAMVWCIILVIVGGTVISCWVEVPRKERDILTEYYKWFE